MRTNDPFALSWQCLARPFKAAGPSLVQDCQPQPTLAGADFKHPFQSASVFTLSGVVFTEKAGEEAQDRRERGQREGQQG